jgi:hypothetical protein
MYVSEAGAYPIEASRVGYWLYPQTLAKVVKACQGQTFVNYNCKKNLVIS